MIEAIEATLMFGTVAAGLATILIMLVVAPTAPNSHTIRARTTETSDSDPRGGPSDIEQAKQAYVAGRLSEPELEWRIEAALSDDGDEDEGEGGLDVDAESVWSRAAMYYDAESGRVSGGEEAL